MEQKYIDRLNKDIYALCRNALKLAFTNPGRFAFLLKTLFYQIKAAKLRKSFVNDNITVPAFMIFSVTSKCNLNCKGCYAQSQHREASPDISIDKLRSILNESKELGISIALISGGEPLARKDLLGILSEFPRTLFALFTNGLLVDDSAMKTFSENKNIIPIVSIEGSKNFTDTRRGEGTYQNITGLYRKLENKKIFFGTSITITSENYKPVFEGGFIEEAVRFGCGLFFFIEYIPVLDGTDNLLLSEEQKEEIKKYVVSFQQKYPALFLSFPSGEDIYGGCLAAGRGFIHISADGKLEPCPFSPYSDSDLNKMSLKEALKSDLLKKIRENHGKMKESRGGCALWENRAWVEEISAKK